MEVRKDLFKRICAGILAVLVVAGTTPANVWSPLTEGTTIVASADPLTADDFVTKVLDIDTTEIKLDQDIDLSDRDLIINITKDLTVDLNGHSLTISEASIQCNAEGKVLTFTDTSEEGTGKAINIKKFITNGGSIRVEGGTYYMTTAVANDGNDVKLYGGTFYIGNGETQWDDAWDEFIADGYTKVEKSEDVDDGEGIETTVYSYTIKAIPTAADFTFTAPTSKTYCGQGIAATVEATDDAKGMGDITVMYKDTSSEDAEWTNTPPTDVGSYAVGVKVKDGTKYAASDDVITAENWKYNVTAKQLTVNWTDPDVYNGKEQSPTVELVGVIEGDVCTPVIAGKQKDAKKSTDAGLSLTGADSKNYKLSNADKSKKFMVQPRPVELEWDEDTELVYDGKTKTVKATVKNLVEGDSCTVDVAPTNGKDVGEYGVTATRLSNRNYVIDNNTNASCEVTITKKTISAEWDDTELVYNGTEQAPAFTLKGVVDGDDCDAEVSGKIKNARTASTAKLTLTGEDKGNYKLDKTASKSFIINTKPVELEWDDEPLVYNGKKQKGKATVTNLEEGDTCNVNISETESKDVGEYDVMVRSTTNRQNYGHSFETHKVSIVPKSVEITWENTEFVYDGEEHSPEATISGVIDGEEVEVTVSGAAAEAGKHEAKASISDKNYTITKGETVEFEIKKSEDSDTNSDTDSKVDTDSDTDSKVDTDSDTDSKVDTDSDTDSKVDTDSDTDSKGDTDSKTDSKGDTDSKSDSKNDTDSKTDSKNDTDSKTDSKNDTDSKSDSKDDTDSKSDDSSKPVENDIMYGDVNGDGNIDIIDIGMVAAHVKGIKPLTDDQFKRADVNHDGQLTVTDIAMIAAHVKGIKPIT